MEIGCGDASFLLEAYKEYNNIKYFCLEKDQNTIDERNKYTWLKQYSSFEEINAAIRKFDLIGFFHVFEHIKSPTEFLMQCRSVLSEKGCLLIEVPSFDDPLLQLYKSDIYSKFYFQKQHPYIYSAGSIKRVLENNGFKILELIPFQRYSLENHLNWLVNSKPGGNEGYQAVFKDVDEGYRHAIEKTGKSDSVIFIVQ